MPAAQDAIVPELRSPADARRIADRLLDKKHDRERRQLLMARDREKLYAYLAIVAPVTAALEKLNDQVFQQFMGIVQDKLTSALGEILEQPIKFVAEADFKRKTATVDFFIERDGNREDVLRGQGGSVANILSVGLRLFALATLDSKQHRRFLVLDEQDCWLRPDLVPRLVKIVYLAARELGFQVLMISHHDRANFERFADKIYEFVPGGANGVEVREVAAPRAETDAGHTPSA